MAQLFIYGKQGQILFNGDFFGWVVTVSFINFSNAWTASAAT